MMGSQIPQDSLESEKGEARAQHAHQPGQIFASHSHSGSLLCIADSICPPQGSTDPSCSYPGTCSLEMGRLCFVQSPWQGEGTVWIQLPVPPAMTGVSGSVCRRHSRGCQDLQGQSLQQGVRHVPGSPSLSSLSTFLPGHPSSFQRKTFHLDCLTTALLCWFCWKGSTPVLTPSRNSKGKPEELSCAQTAP